LVGLKGDHEGKYSSVIYALSAAKAKYERMRRIWDVWSKDGTWNGEPISFAILTCKRVGEFHPLSLRWTADNRGLAFVHAGMLIEVDGERGVIVASNDSGNFDVIFTEGKHKGLTLNCHPKWQTRYFDADGKVLADFTGKAVA
jgi:hypothetical protein